MEKNKEEYWKHKYYQLAIGITFKYVIVFGILLLIINLSR